MASLVALSIDIYLPAIPIIMRQFSTSYGKVQLSIGLFLLGFGLSQLIYGPMSDKFGRRPVLIVGLGIYFFSTVLCILAPTIDILIFARFIQAIGACGATVSSFAIVRDLFEGKECARRIAYLTTSMGCVPVLAPIIGSYLQYLAGWRSNFVFLLVISGILIFIVYFKLPETGHRNSLTSISPKSIVKNYLLILSNPLYQIFSLCSVFSFAALFSFVANSPYYIVELAGASPQYFSLLFAINALALILGGYVVTRITQKLDLGHIIAAGAYIVLIGGGLLNIQLLIVKTSLFYFISAMSICTFGIAMIMPTAMAGVLTIFPEKAGSASAMAGSLRFLGASLMATLVGYLQVNNPTTLALIITINASFILILVRKNRLITQKICNNST